MLLHEGRDRKTSFIQIHQSVQVDSVSKHVMVPCSWMNTSLLLHQSFFMKGAWKVYQAKDLCNSVTQNLERKKTNHLKVNQCPTLTFSALWPTATNSNSL